MDKLSCMDSTGNQYIRRNYLVVDVANHKEARDYVIRENYKNRYIHAF